MTAALCVRLTVSCLVIWLGSAWPNRCADKWQPPAGTRTGSLDTHHRAALQHLRGVALIPPSTVTPPID